MYVYTYLHSQPHVHFPEIVRADMFPGQLRRHHTEFSLAIHFLKHSVVVEVDTLLANLLQALIIERHVSRTVLSGSLSACTVSKEFMLTMPYL